MTETGTQKRSIIMMVICASLWSIAGIFIKLLPWNPLVIAGFRSLIAACVVFAFMLYSKIRIVFNRDSLLSGVFMSLTFLAFVTANKLTTSANAIVLQFTAPVFILILSALVYKQRFRKADIIVVLVTLFGIALFFFDQFSPGNLLGNCIAICAGLFMAVMFLTTGHADENSRMSGILLGHLFTALVGVPMAFIFPTPVSTGAVLSILALGIVQLGIPYVLYGLAVKGCPPLACSLLGAIEPLLNPIWVFLFDGEAPGFYALIGGVIVIAAITSWCIWRDRQPQIQ
ncbi:EamA family transporter [Hydrogenoanaerobacterium sp.]|uniref:DMT family transporter n=1 Tax=Hydrogenoanaerobacterium sp. TaxID=2953763 RepID=UPI00289AF1A2|nr:EamA family transporter [Hydrogenoanaerobacterium sp.]